MSTLLSTVRIDDANPKVYPIESKPLYAHHAMPEVVVISHKVSDISNMVLDIVFEYALNKFDDSKDRLDSGRATFVSVVDRFVAVGGPIMMCLPAFPFKSANKVYKVLGTLPDKAEELSLERLNNMCLRIKEVYAPGARLTVISDGLVYNGKPMHHSSHLFPPQSLTCDL